MNGPCMCGDPYCYACGNPYAAEVEAAEEWSIETLSRAKLTPNEYRTAVQIGLLAVRHARQAVDNAAKSIAAAEAEEAAMKRATRDPLI